MPFRCLILSALLLAGGRPADVRAKQAPAGPHPVCVDVGPNMANGTVNARACTAGLMTGLAGDENALYAVSLNAGIWKSVRGGPWRQLAESPACACCLAQDPGHPQRLAVGERNGLAIPIERNTCGVWESQDAGEHWTYTFDPLSLPNCASQAVPAVAFSRRSTLFIGTARGLGRKPAGARHFDFSLSPPGVGAVTAIAVGESTVWARTRDRLLVSRDDGRSWKTLPIPATVDGVPIRFGSRGDLFSLAAFDTLAVLVFRPEPDTTGNRNTLLLYDPASDRWQVQTLETGNGTGLGGRRFLKAYVLHDPTLPDGLGGKLQLFFGAGQEIHQALGRNPDGTLHWDRAVMTQWGGPYPYPPNPIHSDTWDFHIPPTYSPQTDPTAWIACDGGIYRAMRPQPPPADFAGRAQQMQWVTMNDGLHTHHIHTLTVLAVPGRPARLAYPTSDNDAWYGNATQGWQHEDYLGDANWTQGDSGNPALALLARRSAGFVMLTTFGDPPPDGTQVQDRQVFTLTNDERFDGPLGFQCIQTLQEEKPLYPTLDAVMLARMPLLARDETGALTPVPGPLGTASPNGALVLIRNRAFAVGPDANRTRFQNWRLEASDLPPGVTRLWVSGGHAHPTYYVFAPDAQGGGFYRRDPGDDTWKRLPNAQRQARSAFTPLDGGVYGPAFVNPYDPQVLFLLTDRGVLASTDRGANFRPDATLTALLTGNGAFPLRTGELSGNGAGVVLAGRANATGTLAHIAFDRDHPEAVVVASPFTGVFYAENAGHAWRDISAFLPTPLSSVSSVGIDGDSLYVATEGRGLLRIVGYQNAPLAAIFGKPEANPRGGWIVPLNDSTGTALPNIPVTVRICTPPNAEVYHATLRTDPNGRLFLPRAWVPETGRIELRCGGSIATVLLSQGKAVL